MYTFLSCHKVVHSEAAVLADYTVADTAERSCLSKSIITKHAHH